MQSEKREQLERKRPDNGHGIKEPILAFRTSQGDVLAVLRRRPSAAHTAAEIVSALKGGGDPDDCAEVIHWLCRLEDAKRAEAMPRKMPDALPAWRYLKPKD